MKESLINNSKNQNTFIIKYCTFCSKRPQRLLYSSSFKKRLEMVKWPNHLFLSNSFKNAKWHMRIFNNWPYMLHTMVRIALWPFKNKFSLLIIVRYLCLVTELWLTFPELTNPDNLKHSSPKGSFANQKRSARLSQPLRRSNCAQHVHALTHLW